MGVRSIAQLAVIIAAFATPVSSWGQGFDLTQTREVRGVVVEAGTGAPVSGAKVSLRWQEHWRVLTNAPELEHGVTDARGEFAISTPMEANQAFRIYVEGEGVVRTMTGIFEGLPAEPVRIEIPTATKWISGRVASPEGRPWTEGKVHVGIAGEPLPTFELMHLPLDANGFFMIGPLADGEYLIRHLLPGKADGPEATGVRPVEARRTAESMITLVRPLPPHLKVRVVDDAGEPVLEGDVTLQGNTASGSKREYARLDAHTPGMVTFLGSEAGRYLVSAVTPKGSAYQEYLIEKGLEDAGGEVVVTIPRGTGRVEGVVRGESGSTSGTIFAALVKRVEPTASGLRPDLTIRGEVKEGKFEFQNLEAGRYDLQIEQRSVNFIWSDEFALAEGEAKSFEVNVPATREVVIRGVVKDTEGRPIAGCRLSLEGQYYSDRDEASDEEGRFEFHCALPAVDGNSNKPWQILARHPKYDTLKVEFEVNPEAMETQRDLVLTARRTVRIEFVPVDETERAQLPGVFDIRFGERFFWDKAIAGDQRYRIDLGDPVASAISAFPVSTGEPASFRFEHDKIETVGEPMWHRDGNIVDGRRVKIAADDTSAYVVRIRLRLKDSPARNRLHVRLVDYKTGEPVEGHEVSIDGKAGGRTLYDGTCAPVLEAGAQYLHIKRVFPVSASLGTLGRTDHDIHSADIKLPENPQTSPEAPLEVRAVRLVSRRWVQLFVRDATGNDLSRKVTVVDGDLEWRASRTTSRRDISPILVRHTGDSVHRMYLMTGSGDNPELELDSIGRRDGIEVGKDEKGLTVLRIDFEKLHEGPMNDTYIIVKGAVSIPEGD